MSLRQFRLAKLSFTTQLAIVVALAGGLSWTFYYHCLAGPLAERNSLREEVDRLQAEVSQGASVISQLRRFKSELKQLEARLLELRSILPAEKETPIVLRTVQRMASESNLKIMRFKPHAVVSRAFYSDWPIVMEVQGAYDALGLFFERISHFTRIINVDNINIKNIEGSTDSNRTLSAVWTATTFVFREDQMSPTPEK